MRVSSPPGRCRGSTPPSRNRPQRRARSPSTAGREDIGAARQFADLPKNAQAYVRAVEDLIGAPGSAVGVGPRRDRTVQLRQIL